MSSTAIGAHPTTHLESLLRAEVQARFADLPAVTAGISSVSGLLSIHLWEDGRRCEVQLPEIPWWRIPEGMVASSYAADLVDRVEDELRALHAERTEREPDGTRVVVQGTLRIRLAPDTTAGEGGQGVCRVTRRGEHFTLSVPEAIEAGWVQVEEPDGDGPARPVGDPR